MIETGKCRREVLVLVCAIYPWSVSDEGYSIKGVQVSYMARGIHILFVLSLASETKRRAGIGVITILC
jgi:hypothetical protein